MSSEILKWNLWDSNMAGQMLIIQANIFKNNQITVFRQIIPSVLL